jgi:hypothetical protein
VLIDNTCQNTLWCYWTKLTFLFWKLSVKLALSHTHSWSRALLEKPPTVQLLKNFLGFYGTRRFITVFTRVLHWSLSSARWIQSIQFHPIFRRLILIVKLALLLFEIKRNDNIRKMEIYSILLHYFYSWMQANRKAQAPCMTETHNRCSALFVNSEGNRPFGRHI